MAHEVEGNARDGYKAFFVAKPPWWYGATVIKDAPDVDTAWKMAYPHTLLEETIYTSDGTPLENWKAIKRDDGLEIACVRKTQEVMQPYEHFKFFEPYITKGLADLEAGGSLRNGTRMWALAKIKDGTADVVKGDPIEAYLLAYTGFDGSLAYGIKLTATRVVCANTLALAQGQSALHDVKHTIRHTKNMRLKQDRVSFDVQKAIAEYYNHVDVYKSLAAKQVTAKAMVNYIYNVFVPEDVQAKLKEEGKNVPAPTMTKIERVVELLDTQKGLDLVPAVRGTAWQAYGAVSEYLTHEQGRTDDTRLNNQWFGDSVKVNNRALQSALVM